MKKDRTERAYTENGHRGITEGKVRKNFNTPPTTPPPSRGPVGQGVPTIKVLVEG